MATYYVRADGNDSNTGLGPATNQAWQTIGKALGATGIGSGDTLYVAPGDYRQTATITVGGTYSTATQVIGDPTASQFSGIVAGRVLITNRLSNDVGNSAGNFALFTLSSKNYLQFYNFVFEQTSTSSVFALTDSANLEWHKSFFQNHSSGATISVTDTTTNGLTKNYVFRQCINAGLGNGGFYTDTTIGKSGATQNFTYNVTFDRCFLGATISLQNSGGATYTGSGYYIYNCQSMGLSVTNLRDGLIVKNTTGANGATWSVTGSLGAGGTGIVSNCVCFATSGFSGYTITNLRTAKYTPYNTGIQRVWGLSQVDWWTAGGLYTYATGDTSGTPAVDFYDVAWAGGAPNVGSYNNYTDTLAGQYNPTERNASTITITPGSTSQSIELYLGATGLTASTSGLSAYYNRTRSADVQINLQARNITQNWTSGGFAEVNPNTMPGVYRLDIPNEALASGADDVTVVVRGASGTNGAVMSIKLSSGGLTTAQTASAVWNALTNDHTTHGTFGWNVLRADQDSKEGLVTLHQSGGVSRVDADVHAVANDTAAATALKGALLHDGTGYVDSDVVRVSTSTAAADELEGALLHNGTDYIDSNLVGGNSTRVFVGRFQMTQTGTTQGDIIEAFTTDTPAFELQLFDGDNNLVPVTGATLGLRILDVTSTVVETGTPTIEYGTGGIVRWTAPGTYLSIGCPAGMYRLFVDRTVSGTTTTFGPLQIKVQVQ